jgi:hypothetical protein
MVLWSAGERSASLSCGWSNVILFLKVWDSCVAFFNFIYLLSQYRVLVVMDHRRINRFFLQKVEVLKYYYYVPGGAGTCTCWYRVLYINYGQYSMYVLP